MDKITFLILHYKTYSDTIHCIESIEKCSYPKKTIIVVDNGSNDGSIEKVEKVFPESNQLFYIKSHENLGFARGNNLGFLFAKDRIHPEFIVMINNDIVIQDVDFCEKIIEEYSNSNYHVLGCDIRRPDGSISNPIGPEYQSLVELEATIHKRERQLLICKMGLEPLISIRKRILNKIYRPIEKKTEDKIGLLKKYQLHGSCLIFGPEYIQNYDGLLPITFLYEEESVLRYVCDRDHLRMVYAPVATVLHNEQQATKLTFTSLRTRKKFFYQNSLQSLKQLSSFIKSSVYSTWK